MAELFRTRRARAVVALTIVTFGYVLLGFWAGAMTEGFWGALRIGGIALVTALILWGIVGGIILLVGWVWKGEPRGRQR